MSLRDIPGIPAGCAGAFVETHCHLDDAQFADDREQVVERALSAGIGMLVSIGTGEGPPDLEAGIRMAERFPQVYASLGVHPHDAAKATGETWANIRSLASHPKVLLLGEMGLDFHYDHSPRDVQRSVFAKQLEIAGELGIPISIHTREAWAETVACLREVWQGSGPGGIFHCFSGGVAEAEEALSLGFHLGIGGVVTFPKAEALRLAVAATPLNRLLLETDAPYLAPVPFRGKRNEPAHLVHSARKLAEVKNLSLETFRDATTKNFTELVFAAKLANQ
ncbi:MAG: TatD family hydrolase [Bryobacterales bacterium]|nr:TatD family hydrolase [Bryobacterales bacterium]